VVTSLDHGASRSVSAGLVWGEGWLGGSLDREEERVRLVCHHIFLIKVVALERASWDVFVGLGDPLLLCVVVLCRFQDCRFVVWALCSGLGRRSCRFGWCIQVRPIKVSLVTI
jgi:hypothetical protein